MGGRRAGRRANIGSRYLEFGQREEGYGNALTFQSLSVDYFPMTDGLDISLSFFFCERARKVSLVHCLDPPCSQEEKKKA
jgi:hypothetical protein